MTFGINVDAIYISNGGSEYEGLFKCTFVENGVQACVDG